MKSEACTDVNKCFSEAEVEVRTSRVTVSKDELAAIQCDIVNAVQNLKEQVHELNRISRRACAIVNVRHVGHMAVVW